MRPLARVRGREELLDSPAHAPALLAGSLAHVAAVNRWLGGYRALRLALRPHLREGMRILDVGTGSADLPRAIVRDARRRRVPVRVTATDLHPQMRAIAARATRAYPEIEVAEADALRLPFADDAFDVALLSMVLHHLEDEPAVRALREAARVAPVVIVNELHRTRINYAGAKLLAATLWSRNPITRHDGPLSVLRAYRPDELGELAHTAGLHVRELQRRWFYRVVLVAARG